MTEIYRYLYDSIRNGVPFPVKPEEAFAVVRATAEIKRQNPGISTQLEISRSTTRPFRPRKTILI